MSGKIVFSITLFLIAGVQSIGMAQTIPGTPQIVITNLPNTIDEFVALRDSIAATPVGGAAAFVVAMVVYTRDIELGMQCFTASLFNDGSLLRRVTPGGYEGMEPVASFQREVTILQREPWIATSYIYGTSIEKGYRLGNGPYRIVFNPYNPRPSEEGFIELQVYTSGTDNPRRIVLKANNRGVWKVWFWKDLVKPVRTPDPFIFYEDDI